MRTTGIVRFGLAAVLTLAASGVCHAQRGSAGGRCPTLPPGALPAPRGSFLQAWADRQAAKAEPEDFVIYLQEWYCGGVELGPYGRYHVGEIARRLPHTPFFVVIEEDCEPALNRTRLEQVTRHLAACGVTDAHRRVVLGRSQAEGLRGDEAVGIYARSLRGTLTFGGLGTLSGIGNFGGFGSFGLGALGGFGGGVQR